MKTNFFWHTEKKRFGFGMAALAAMIALVLSICIGCKAEPDEPKTKPEIKALKADAGPDQTRTLANDLSVVLDGSKSAAYEGSIESYVWTCVSYIEFTGVQAPYTAEQVTGMINGADNVTATVALRKAGTYVFRLTVTADNGESAASNVTVKVDPCIMVVIVTASFPGITAGNTLDFAPAYGNGYEDGDVTYTLKDDITGALNGSVVNADTYTAGETITFTQIFYGKGGEELNRRLVVKANVDSPAEVEVGDEDESEGEEQSQSFSSLRDGEGTPLPGIPVLDLNITEQVVEILE